MTLRNGNAAAESAYCFMTLMPSSDGTKSFYYWGIAATLEANGAKTPLTVTDGIDVAPGTYDDGRACSAYGVPNISAEGADMTVVATAR